MAKEQQLLSAYLIVGSDQLKRETAIKRLKAHLDEGLADFNLDERDGSSELTDDVVLGTLQTMPFGPGFRLVIIHDADKLAKPTSEAIISYLDDPNPGCVLCLEAESLPKNTRLYKAVAKQGKTSVVDCSPRKRWELPGHVQQMARVHGVEIDHDAAAELVSLVGESTVMLDNSLRALSELMGKGAHITLGDVRANVARTAEVKPWDFLDALCERDVSRAISLYRLMQNPSQIALLSMANTRVRELICAQSLDLKGESYNLPAALAKRDWQVKNHVRWARGFSSGELEGRLVAGCECDQALKSSDDSESAFVSYLLGFAR